MKTDDTGIAEIISLAEKGNENAVEQLILICQDDIYSMAYIMLKNQQDAEDAVQVVLYKLFRNLHTLKEPAKFRSWYKVITINTCKTLLTKNKKNTVVSYDEDESIINISTDDQSGDFTEILPQEKLERIEKANIIFDIMKDLSDEHREVLLLRFVENKTYADIAGYLGININTVKSRIFMAKKNMKELIVLYEKQHNTKLHTIDLFSNFRLILSNLSYYVNVPSSLGSSIGANLSSFVNAVNSSSGIITSVTNIAASGVSNYVGASISNTVATKISIATAAVSVAACIGIVSQNLTSDSLPPVDEQSSVIAESSEPVSETTVQEPSVITSTVIETSTVVSVVPEISTVYRDSEPSIIYRDSEPSIIYRDSEPSTVYVTVPAESAVRNYSKYVNVFTDDKTYQFRVYPESNEATILKVYFADKELYEGKNKSVPFTYKVILPSYVNYDGRNIPVTRISRNAVAQNGNFYEDICAVQLPEHLKEIPENLFGGYELEEITGGHDVERIGSYALSDLCMDRLDLNNLFPNLLEIDAYAIGRASASGKTEIDDAVPDLLVTDDYETGWTQASNVMEYTCFDEVVLPKAYNALSDPFTPSTKVNKLTVYYDNDDPDKVYPYTKDTFKVILTGDEVNNLTELGYMAPFTSSYPQANVSNNVSKPEIKNFYIELENKDAVFPSLSWDKDQMYDEVTDRTSGSRLGYMIDRHKIENLYLPEGMKTIREFEFKGISPENPQIENLYLPSSITTVETNAFYGTSYADENRNIQYVSGIQNIMLPVKGKTNEQISKLKRQIIHSGGFKYSREDSDYMYFIRK